MSLSVIVAMPYAGCERAQVFGPRPASIRRHLERPVPGYRAPGVRLRPAAQLAQASHAEPGPAAGENIST